MVFQNTYRGFLYRQLFITPPPVTPAQCSLVGKAGIVTGSNSGLGYQASSQLLSLGLSRLILAVRDVTKGEAARSSLLSAFDKSSNNTGSSSRSSERRQPIVEVWQVDMADYASIMKFAQRVRDTQDLTVDFVILNAGVARFDFETSKLGNEMTIQTNWLGTALLATVLRPILQQQYRNARRGKDARAESHSAPVLSIIGSETAAWAAFKEHTIAVKENRTILSVLNDKSKSNMGDRYYLSKLLLEFFFLEFIKRLPSDNEVIVNMVNPGFCYGSDLHRGLTGVLGKIFAGMKRAIGRSTEVGARTLTHGAVIAGKETHGCYLSDEKVMPFADFPLTVEGEACGRQLFDEMSTELSPIQNTGAIVPERS